MNSLISSKILERESSNIFYLEYEGTPFTWSNKREGEGLILKDWIGLWEVGSGAT